MHNLSQGRLRHFSQPRGRPQALITQGRIGASVACPTIVTVRREDRRGIALYPTETPGMRARTVSSTIFTSLGPNFIHPGRLRQATGLSSLIQCSNTLSRPK